MTFLEMQLNFEQMIRNNIKKDIDIRTIDIEYYLNRGYDVFIEEWYKVFETNESARKRLNPLIKRIVYNNADSVGNYPRSLSYILPDDLRYVVQEDSIISYTDCHNKPATHVAEVKPIKLDYYNKHINNSFKKPYKKLVWRIDIGDSLKSHDLIYGDDTNTINTYSITYLSNQPKITLISGSPETDSVEIVEEFHNEIVENAVKIAIETFQIYNSLKQPIQ